MDGLEERVFEVSVEAFETKTGTAVTLGKATKQIRVSSTAPPAGPTPKVTIEEIGSGPYRTGQPVGLRASVENFGSKQPLFLWKCGNEPREPTDYKPEVTKPCTYVTEGTYIVKVTAKSIDGGIKDITDEKHIYIGKNNPPEIPIVLFSSSPVKYNAIVKATADATDSENDNVLYKFIWKKDGNEIQTQDYSTQKVSKLNLGSKGVKKGDTVTVTVQVKDDKGAVQSTTVTKTLTLSNDKPNIDSIKLDYTAPVYVGAVLKCIVKATDPEEGTLSNIEYKWYVNRVVKTTAGSPSITDTYTAEGVGNKIKCKATAIDSQGEKSAESFSDEVMVENRKPVVTVVSPPGSRWFEDREFTLSIKAVDVDSKITSMGVVATFTSPGYDYYLNGDYVVCSDSPTEKPFSSGTRNYKAKCECTDLNQHDCTVDYYFLEESADGPITRGLTINTKTATIINGAVSEEIHEKRDSIQFENT